MSERSNPNARRNRSGHLTRGSASWAPIFVAWACMLALCGTTVTKAEAAPPNFVLIGTSQAGTNNNAIGSGLAKVIMEDSPLQVRVRVFSGPGAWLPEVNDGDLSIGAVMSASAWMAYHGMHTSKALSNLRLLRASESNVLLGFAVHASSGIKTIKDLKGKRVAGGYAAQPIIRRLAQASLEAYGLSYKDVTSIPVLSVGAGMQALADGRVDAAWNAVTSPNVARTNANTAVRFLTFDNNQKVLRSLRQNAFPGVDLEKAPIGRPWAKKGAIFAAYGNYLVTSKNENPKTVDMLLKVLWKHSKELKKIYPGLAGFTNATAVTDTPVIPYDPTAIAFYKSVGVWTAAAQAAQDKLLKN